MAACSRPPLRPMAERGTDRTASCCRRRRAAAIAGSACRSPGIVTVDRSVSNAATVEGEVVKGAILPLSAKGERLLDLIAAAGGAGAPGYEIAVRLSRGGVTATIPMEALVTDPRQNIYAEPGDVLTVVG